MHGKEPSKKWQTGCWHYQWYANGMLKSVQKPSGAIVSFEYDALGRRIAKIFKDTITRYVWEGNVLLHEWKYNIKLRPKLVVGDLGELYYDAVEPTDDVITWVYEDGSFTPIAKLVDGERFSIVSDYLGTPIQAFDSSGELIWERELNIYGGVRKETGIAGNVSNVLFYEIPKCKLFIISKIIKIKTRKSRWATAHLFCFKGLKVLLL